MKVLSQGALVITFAVLLLKFGPAWADSTVGTGNGKEDQCHLSLDRKVVLPLHLTMVQRGYFIELCVMVSSETLGTQQKEIALELRHKGLLGDSENYSEEEYRIRKSLYNINSQHYENLAKLVEQTLGAQRFDEETFWKSWIAERKRWNEEAAPFRGRVVEMGKQKK